MRRLVLYLLSTRICPTLARVAHQKIFASGKDENTEDEPYIKSGGNDPRIKHHHWRDHSQTTRRRVAPFGASTSAPTAVADLWSEPSNVARIVAPLG